ncbi:MAG: hypothetical protein ABIN01_19805 [Ferruginibacter sp.]
MFVNILVEEDCSNAGALLLTQVETGKRIIFVQITEASIYDRLEKIKLGPNYLASILKHPVNPFTKTY